MHGHEATANVDPATDATIQTVIRHALPETSVLTVAHRLATIVFYDKVLVLARDEALGAGTRAEYDAPARGVLSQTVTRSVVEGDDISPHVPPCHLSRYDTPAQLLEQPGGSIFRGMCEATGNLTQLLREAHAADAERAERERERAAAAP